MSIRFPLILLGMALLGGCDSVQNYLGREPDQPVLQTAAANGRVQASTIVRRGDTVYSLSQKYNVPVRALIEANRLEAPYILLVGQRLLIPQERTHTVVRGDTLYAVSRKYGVDVSSLVRVNRLAPPYVIRVGQTLTLPAGVATASGQVPAASAPLVASAPPQPVPAVGSVTVAPLAPPPAPAPTPAASLPVAVPAPVVEPAKPDPAPLPVATVPPVAPPPPEPAKQQPPAASSQTAVAPVAPPPATPVPPVAAPQPTPAEAAPPKPGDPVKPVDPPKPVEPPKTPDPVKPADPAPEQTAKPAEPATPVPSTEAPAPAPAPARGGSNVASLPNPPARGGRTFQWPVVGRVIASYGEMGQGLRNDGINILANKGAPIRAAENGVVVYAGDEIKGFGNLLLIRHADGFTSAYAHADALVVNRGDTVRRGQVIARVGQTGNVTQPQLHFEIRKGTQAVDPQEYLGRPTAFLPHTGYAPLGG